MTTTNVAITNLVFHDIPRNIYDTITPVADQIYLVEENETIEQRIANTLNNYTPTNNFANVAFSGEYSDILNSPSIPAAQVQSDWNAVSGMGVILNKPTLGDMAFVNTVDYSNITNTPTIGDATITFMQGDINRGSITLNQTNNATITFSSGQTQVAWEDISNKPTFATVATSGEYSDVLNTPTLATVATSGEYSDLLNTPSIPAAQVQTDWNAVSGMGVILNKPTLSTVATSGEYSDLLNTPTIPVIDATYNGQSSNAQSGIGIEGELTNRFVVVNALPASPSPNVFYFIVEE